MSIADFHSSMQAKDESSALFTVLRQLKAADPQTVRRGEGGDFGWDPWQ